MNAKLKKKKNIDNVTHKTSDILAHLEVKSLQHISIVTPGESGL